MSLISKARDAASYLLLLCAVLFYVSQKRKPLPFDDTDFLSTFSALQSCMDFFGPRRHTYDSTSVAVIASPRNSYSDTRRTLSNLEYDGSRCDFNGPKPSSGNVVMQFVGFGDSPYDSEVGHPFEGPEYECLKEWILPGVKSLSEKADFVVHVGDIKKGGRSYSRYCTDTVFGSRRKLFGTLESDVDFFIVVGDNEFNECSGYDPDPNVSDAVKTKWRNYFTRGSFKNFDRTNLPSTVAPKVRRQPGNRENFYFFYNTARIAFFGITEPYADKMYDPINADWLSRKLSGRVAPKAIIIFAHHTLSEKVLRVLDKFRKTPMLLVRGNNHVYCMEYLDRSRFPNFIEHTVGAFSDSPRLISVIEDPTDGKYFFHSKDTKYGARCDY